MKDFLKFTLATVTGIILSSIVLFIVSMVTLFGIMSTSDTETIVKKNSVMMLDLNGTLVERTQENPLDILSQLFSDDSNIYGLDDILSSIKKAKENENIKGIYLQASSLGTSYASLQEIRNALLDFKESGKFIIAYGDSYTQGLYYLSSVADKVLLRQKTINKTESKIRFIIKSEKRLLTNLSHHSSDICRQIRICDKYQT